MNTASIPPLTPLIRSREAAAILGLQPQTLRAWRLRGAGPAYVRVGGGSRGRVLYRPEDVARWIAQRTFNSTAEEAVANAAPGSR